LLAKGADVLVLGCTHYPFLADEIRDLVGPGVEIIDPATAVARELRRRLDAGGLLSTGDRMSKQRFLTTGTPIGASAIMSQLLGTTIDVEPVSLDASAQQ
jgi:glutamate racemase